MENTIRKTEREKIQKQLLISMGAFAFAKSILCFKILLELLQWQPFIYNVLQLVFSVNNCMGYVTEAYTSPVLRDIHTSSGFGTVYFLP